MRCRHCRACRHTPRLRRASTAAHQALEHRGQRQQRRRRRRDMWSTCSSAWVWARVWCAGALSGAVPGGRGLGSLDAPNTRTMLGWFTHECRMLSSANSRVQAMSFVCSPQHTRRALSRAPSKCARARIAAEERAASRCRRGVRPIVERSGRIRDAKGRRSAKARRSAVDVAPAKGGAPHRGHTRKQEQAHRANKQHGGSPLATLRLKAHPA